MQPSSDPAMLLDQDNIARKVDLTQEEVLWELRLGNDTKGTMLLGQEVMESGIHLTSKEVHLEKTKEDHTQEVRMLQGQDSTAMEVDLISKEER